ncbi:PREDICTED: uncharacterized protein C12orf73 homolog isoform X2 [Myotis brandtii]|uniref:uncharacterized protein C12orf73 homolog isoform X2 n=1 Tax=Myotis brandtii TaxID=109478 RepID=UPI000703DC2A|nr:PREDICTED: uncharacterized protein C12orf73 homolog isoform X2 [Myotis brandtii]
MPHYSQSDPTSPRPPGKPYCRERDEGRQKPEPESSGNRFRKHFWFRPEVPLPSGSRARPCSLLSRPAGLQSLYFPSCPQAVRSGSGSPFRPCSEPLRGRALRPLTMPAGVPWTTYLKMFTASLLAMFAGSQVVHRQYLKSHQSLENSKRSFWD